MATTHPLDGTESSSSAGGRPLGFKPEHIAVLHYFVIEPALASLQETMPCKAVVWIVKKIGAAHEVGQRKNSATDSAARLRARFDRLAGQRRCVPVDPFG